MKSVMNLMDILMACMLAASGATIVRAIVLANVGYSRSSLSRRSAVFRVSQYWNPDCATFFYMMQYPEGIIDSPPGWEEQDISAKKSQLLCMPYLEPDLQECIWAAQYEEYIALFSTHLIPEAMTLDDIADVIKTINAQMVEHLYQREPKAMNKQSQLVIIILALSPGGTSAPLR